MRLPTEAEGEKAAQASVLPIGGDRGRAAHRFPWGDEDWDPQRANVYEDGIRRATSVGMYPLGATPSGLLDLAGNVWEWTSSLYQPYPYWPDDSREDQESEGPRVVRGGSWVDSRWRGRCAYRYRSISDFGDPLGFRVVVSLALPSSDSWFLGCLRPPPVPRRRLPAHKCPGRTGTNILIIPSANVLTGYHGQMSIAGNILQSRPNEDLHRLAKWVY